MTYVIPLTKGAVAVVDAADHARLMALGVKWCVNDGYAVNGSLGRMHRWLLGLSVGDGMVDHRDGDRLNNRRANLRMVNDSLNQANRRVVRGASKFKGVCRQTRPASKSVWVARIVVSGRQMHLGSFDDEVQAALAYNEAAKRHFGEYAHLNSFS